MRILLFLGLAAATGVWAYREHHRAARWKVAWDEFVSRRKSQRSAVEDQLRTMLPRSPRARSQAPSLRSPCSAGPRQP